MLVGYPTNAFRSTCATVCVCLLMCLAKENETWKVTTGLGRWSCSGETGVQGGVSGDGLHFRSGVECLYEYEEWPKEATINNGHPDSCRGDNSQRTTDRE